jgi:DnaJ like chaperone protein
MFENVDPKTLMKWLMFAGVVYFFLPYDLFPDFLGPTGRIDDILVLSWLGWNYRSQIREFIQGSSGGGQSGAGSSRGSGQSDSTRSEPSVGFDPYEILGVTRSDSSDAIRSAYRERMKEYHPDKVAHLGEELQKLALEKSQQIERAYRLLGD